MVLFGATGAAKDAQQGKNPHVKDTTDQAFRADVLDASMVQPVIVDFWAPWCGPCRTLGPMLERLVGAANGKVKLVKINIDENPAYAQQLRVQSIPTVYAFDKGRPVDGFMGAVPESQLKAFIERLSGQDAGAPDIDGALAAAREAMDLGDFGGAAQVYAGILQEDPEHVKAIAGLARCYLAGGDAARAAEILKMAPADKAGDPDLVSVRTALELADEGRDAGDPTTLETLLRQDPNDHAARFALARARIGRGDLAAAANELLEIVSRNREWNDQAARKLLLKIFDAAGPAADLTKEGRRRLSAILFS